MTQQNNEIVIVGVHREGDTFVITDANAQEHAASSPESLWAAMIAIHGSDEIPKTVVPSSNVAEVQGILSIAQDSIEKIAAERYGPVVGAIAGTLGRNGTKKVLDFMKRNGRR